MLGVQVSQPEETLGSELFEADSLLRTFKITELERVAMLSRLCTEKIIYQVLLYTTFCTEHLGLAWVIGGDCD